MLNNLMETGFIQEKFMLFFDNFIALFVLSAPWLLLGFSIAALIKAFVNMEVMYKYLGGNSVWVSVKAALIGAPLPLCSCGVVPAALGLRAAGASKNATVSFLVATPETGVDSVPFTYALMGPIMAIARPAAAITSAIIAGVLVGKSEQYEQEKKPEEIKSCCESNLVAVSTSCCDEKLINEKQVQEKPAQENKSCCESNQVEVSTSCCDEELIEEKFVQEKLPINKRLSEGFSFAFGKMLRDVINWLMIGLIIAALVQAFLPSSFFEAFGDGFLSMVLMALIGVPMYVCATASTPIAAGFLMAGLSPGAVLVFMLVGPATNIGTLMIVKNELGKRAVLAYLTGIIFTAFAFGFALNFLADSYQWNFMNTMQIHDYTSVAWYEILSALVLGFFVVKAFFQNTIEKFS